MNLNRRHSYPLLITLAALVLSFSPAPAAATDLIRVYLQQTTSSSTILRWRTDTAEDSRVEWGTVAGSPEFSVDDSTVTTEHEVKITGLTPNTVYFYRVGSTAAPLAGGDADHFFKTSPPTGTAVPTRVWALGDSGYPHPGVTIPGVWEQNGDAVRDAYTAFNGGKENADVLLLLGDNAYTNATDPEYQSALFVQYEGFVRTASAWPTLGNHEGFSANGLTQSGPYFDVFTIPTKGEAGGVPSGTEAYYSFDHGNIHFIVLDAEDSLLNYAANLAMLSWLEADCTGNNSDWLIAIWHQPPYSRGLLHDSDVEINEIEARRKFLPILEGCGVDFVLNGHSHNWERSYFITGHYGDSQTFGPEHVIDGGSGDPATDNAYGKPNRGGTPNDGTVYVVAGSASEKRPLGPNAPHPTSFSALSEMGSLILDIDGQTAVGTFLDLNGVVRDTFTIEKGTACPDTPLAGCGDMPKSRLLLAQGSVPPQQKLSWRAGGGNLSAADFGVPIDPSEEPIDVCFYDANGYVSGGQLPGGNGYWSHGRPTVYKFRDPAGVQAGLTRARFRMSEVGKGAISVKGKGDSLRLPELPLTPPVVVQAKNPSTGGCWESTFEAAQVKKNDARRFVAK